MHGPQEPAKLLLIVQILEAGVGLASRWHIDEGEADTSYDLDEEAEQRAAPEDIEPTPGSARHSMACGCSKELAYVEPVINPEGYLSQSFNHFSSHFSRRLAQGRQLTAEHPELTVLNLVLVFIESARRWSGRV